MTRNTNLPSVDAVADYFLTKIDIDSGDSITNLKLQKLCYFAQAISLAERNKPCFSEPIEAWAHGPAIPILYRRFKQYRWQSLDPTDRKYNSWKQLTDDDREFLDGIWAKLSSFSARGLEKITHAHEPWRKAYGDTPTGERCEIEITDKDLKEFYEQKKQKEWWSKLGENGH